MTKFQPDRQLRGSCERFVKAFIARLEALNVWPRPAGIPWPRIGHDYVIPDIERLPELEQAQMKLAECQPLLHMYADPQRSYGPEAFSYVLLPFAERVAASTASGQMFARAFDRWFRVLVAELPRPTVTVLEVRTFPALVSALPRIPLDATSSLQHIGGYLTRRLLKLDFQAPSDAPALWWASGWALVSRYRVEKKGSVWSWESPWWEDSNRVDALRLALKLLHRGPFAEALRISVHLSRLPFHDITVYGTEDALLGMPSRDRSPSEPLEGDDIPALRRLFKHLLNVRPGSPWEESALPRPLSTALFHFDKSYNRKSWTEQVMDCVIALEVLFGVTIEQQHRLASRVALLLGHTDEDVKRLLRKVKEMYDVRSIPAHGKPIGEKRWRRFYQRMMGASPPQVEDGFITQQLELMDDAVEAGRDVVRRAILACLRLQEVPEKSFSWPFGDDLESVLFTSQRLRLQRLARVRAGIAF